MNFLTMGNFIELIRKKNARKATEYNKGEALAFT